MDVLYNMNANEPTSFHRDTSRRIHFGWVRAEKKTAILQRRPVHETAFPHFLRPVNDLHNEYNNIFLDK